MAFELKVSGGGEAFRDFLFASNAFASQFLAAANSPLHPKTYRKMSRGSNMAADELPKMFRLIGTLKPLKENL